MDKIHYVYLTTNLINGKQYIGDHTITNKGGYYLGSGVVILDAIKKYGNPNFFKEILEWFPTRKEAFDAQEKYIKLYKTHVSQEGYNISWTGGTECGGSHSEETKEKLRNKQLGKKVFFSEDHRNHLSKAKINIRFSEEHKNNLRKSKLGKPSPRKGVSLLQTTRDLIGQSCLGYRHTKKTKEKFKNRIPWNKGLKKEKY